MNLFPVTKLWLLFSANFCFISVWGDTTPYYFWFKNKLHDSWILESLNDAYMVDCQQKCRRNSDCIGMAISTLQEDADDHTRTCHLLWKIDESDCIDNDECDKEGYEIYHETKPVVTTTAEAITSFTQEASTNVAPATTATTEPTTTMTEGSSDPNHYNKACSAPPANIVCNQPVEQKFVFGLESKAPLFSDASMEVKCENPYMATLFKSDTTKDVYEPFSGKFVCKERQAITGIEVCFAVNLEYVATECTTLEDGYDILIEEEKLFINSPEVPEKVICGEKEAMISLQLKKEGEGVRVIIGCATVVKK